MMTVVAVLGIDLGKNSCSVVGLDHLARWYCGEGSRATAWRRFLPSCRLVSWRWKRAVVPTSSDVRRRRKDMKFG